MDYTSPPNSVPVCVTVPDYIHLPSTSSTNSYAKEQLHTFSKNHVTCIHADYQSHGRGQYSRKWISPPKTNLLTSFCFYSNAEPLFITRHFANLLQKLLSEFSLSAQIKWPNDLLVNGKKIAGILTETSKGFIIVGVGLNVNMTEEMLQLLDQPATSLLLETKKAHNILDILERLKTLVHQDWGQP